MILPLTGYHMRIRMQLDVIESPSDAKQPWYAAKGGLSFTCTQCGNCCTGGPGYVWISEEEVGRLAAHLKLSVDETIERHCRRVGTRISLKEYRNERGQYDCTFLKEIEATRVVEGQAVRYTKRICEIYPVRPLQCRTWPFWSENLTSEKAWQIAGRRCPGMNEGKRYTVEEVEQIRNAADWPKAPPTSA
jgi:Fe-S-cluster containining protein